MIKQGTRKALKASGTVLLVNKRFADWDWNGDFNTYLVGGDLLMLSGKRDGGKIETVNVATGQRLWMRRDWLVKHTSLAFDARELVFDRERGN